MLEFGEISSAAGRDLTDDGEVHQASRPKGAPRNSVRLPHGGRSHQVQVLAPRVQDRAMPGSPGRSLDTSEEAPLQEHVARYGDAVHRRRPQRVSL